MRAPSERARPAPGTTPAPSAARPLARTPVEQVLALQGSAGNRAVSGVLARDARREPGKDESGERRVVIPGIGSIPLLSVHTGATRRNPGRDERDDPDADTPGEVSLVTKVGDHTARLYRAYIDGKQFEATVHLGGGMKLRMRGAMVASYSVSGESEHWSLQADAVRFETPPRPGAGHESD